MAEQLNKSIKKMGKYIFTSILILFFVGCEPNPPQRVEDSLLYRRMYPTVSRDEIENSLKSEREKYVKEKNIYLFRENIIAGHIFVGMTLEQAKIAKNHRYWTLSSKDSDGSEIWDLCDCNYEAPDSFAAYYPIIDVNGHKLSQKPRREGIRECPQTLYFQDGVLKSWTTWGGY